MKMLGMIAGHPTPKIKEEGAAYTLNSRDYKGVMLIVIAKENENGNSSTKIDSDRMRETSGLSGRMDGYRSMDRYKGQAAQGIK